MCHNLYFSDNYCVSLDKLKAIPFKFPVLESLAVILSNPCPVSETFMDAFQVLLEQFDRLYIASQFFSSWLTTSHIGGKMSSS